MRFSWMFYLQKHKQQLYVHTKNMLLRAARTVTHTKKKETFSNTCIDIYVCLWETMTATAITLMNFGIYIDIALTHNIIIE